MYSDVIVNDIGRETDFEFRVTTQGSRTGTRCINKNKVIQVDMGNVPYESSMVCETDIGKALLASSFLSNIKSVRRDVRCSNFSLRTQCCKRKGLAARSGTKIQNFHGRLRFVSFRLGYQKLLLEREGGFVNYVDRKLEG